VSTAADEQFLRRALELARKGIGLASPNPYVGAIIVDANDNVVGEGTHIYEGVKHAEILALEQAGASARGGTLYINLEPHAHQGRTPPCTAALIAAGIKRVVASMADPNPEVSGRGFEQLHVAGIEVEIGGLADEARCLNEAFARYIRHGIPFVTLKSAMTLDGKIAPRPSQISADSQKDSKDNGFSGIWITGEVARVHVHELRHQYDAILVGIGTVLNDNPLLTDRSGRPRRRPLLRVILDSHLRLPLDCQLVQSADKLSSDLLVFYSQADEKKKIQLEQHGVRVERVTTGTNSRPDFPDVLRRLAELEITSLMIEGGSAINGAVLASGLADKVFLYYAPKLFGAENAVPFASGFSQSPLPHPRIKSVKLHNFGDDIAIEGYLRDPYA